MSDGPKKSDALSLKTYAVASRLLGPVADLTLKHRLKKGKEDPERVQERRGVASKARPEGKLVWIHGASVGEGLSIIPLVERLSKKCPEASFLVTTGTVTSAQLMHVRLPECAIHQFVPIDHPDYVSRFLDHWQPDSAIFVESELWPNLIQLTSGRKIPMALVNGRISPKSYKGWKQRPQAIEDLLSHFEVILAQDKNSLERLLDLSKKEVHCFGNLKMAAPALPANEEELSLLEKAVNGRPIWLASSTHPGEEEIILEAHKSIAQKYPNLLTIIAPRHPERGDELDSLIAENGLEHARRSMGEEVHESTQVYLADTLGELGIFYRLCDVSFVGGSLVEIGGHNPLEPARLKCSILYGPNIFNFDETYREMRASGGTALVRNGTDLSAALMRLLTDDVTRSTMSERAQSWAEESAEETIVNIIDAVLPILPPAEKSNAEGA